jgi:hypothetical protein
VGGREGGRKDKPKITADNRNLETIVLGQMKLENIHVVLKQNMLLNLYLQKHISLRYVKREH